MLTLKQYFDKIIEHRLRVTPIVENNQVASWRATRRGCGTSATGTDPIGAVYALVSQLEGRRL